MVETIVAWLLSWVTPRKEPGPGWDLLTKSQREFNEQVLGRLDQCDEDREELRRDINQLDDRVKECERDREDLRKESVELRTQINRHSIELKSALNISNDPQPPHRTTRNHCQDGTRDE